jgi:exopolyphosphatase/guanosine-5'-triphosphate,3'-diphosphate pyrophosphatase
MRHPCIGPDRVDFVLPGCAIFEAISDMFPAPDVTVADRGLREGMLLRMMRTVPRSGRFPARSPMAGAGAGPVRRPSAASLPSGSGAV